MGLIAQEVEKVFPRLVKTDKDTGLKAVDYASLVAALIEAIKDQQEIIESQKLEINELKNKNTEQDRKIEELIERMERLEK